ncbi:MAG: L-rhamnose mutarotase [Bacteroidetes bacterium]|nr:MAG: L-rhamnose mutarotase [Bacteroidota bacterium]
MPTNRYCLLLDLQDNPQLIAEYEAYHKQVWPEILDSISMAGITNMQIYRWQNRLFMIMDTDATFSFDAKRAADAENPKVQEWEAMMWHYQQALPGVAAGQKWQLMEKIFQL